MTLSPPPGSARTAAIAAAFGGAAASYDAVADVQRQVAQRLAVRIGALSLPPAPTILEIGCGTGFLTEAVHQQHPDARWLVTDLAPAMVARCRAGWGAAVPEARFLAMDGERPCLIPPPGGGFDLICASLAVQWFAEPTASLARLAGLLRPGGVLAWSGLAAGTFAEWRAAHARLGLSAGGASYPEVGAMTAWWPAGGHGRLEDEIITVGYPDGQSFLSVLKQIGAHVARPGYRPLPPGALRRLLRPFAAPAGIAISYQVVYGLYYKDGDAAAGSPFANPPPLAAEGTGAGTLGYQA